jgi:hypothetical protein
MNAPCSHSSRLPALSSSAKRARQFRYLRAGTWGLLATLSAVALPASAHGHGSKASAAKSAGHTSSPPKHPAPPKAPPLKAPPPQHDDDRGSNVPALCRKGFNRVAFDQGLAVGAHAVDRAFEELGREPDRFEELEDQLEPWLKVLEKTARSKSAVAACTALGLITGAERELDVIAADVVRECSEDGRGNGEITATLFCGLAIDVGGVSEPEPAPPPSKSLCGAAFERACNKTFFKTARADAECVPFTKGEFAQVFADTAALVCSFELE